MALDENLRREYFVFAFPLSGHAWDRYAVDGLLPDAPALGGDRAYAIRKLAARINAEPHGGPGVHAETLLALRTLNEALRCVAERYFGVENPGSLERGRQWADRRLGHENLERLFDEFVGLFPPLAVRRAGQPAREYLADVSGPVTGRDRATIEMLLLHLNSGNPAAATAAAALFDDSLLRQRVSFVPFVTGFDDYLDEFEAPGSEGVSILRLLRAPMLASPDSLAGQIAFIRDHWGHLLPDEMRRRLLFALDVLKEIDLARGGEPGPPPVLEFGPGRAGWADDRPEPEAFSRDADWMANVVLMAKSVYVWLDQLSRWHGRPITRLDQIPDEELDRLARWGVNGLWLIGLWERSEASRKIKQYMGNPDAAASAYALKDYHIAHDLGGEDAWRDLSERAGRRGLRLASDMVPNHMGIDSRWVIEHPEYFLQLEHPPYPAYRFTGGDLCDHPGVGVRIEEGYWDHSDAAVVFQRRDEDSGHARYIYHGNDGTSMPWNDTAQLNFLLPEVREAVIQVILDVARRFPIIRFDAAMTLAKKHFQRLWFPAPGDAGAIPSRAEHGMTREQFDAHMPVEFWREVVDRVAAEAPGTLLLAEAFWLMEGYFVRTLGMHRVYNSAFMNMLKMEDNAKYRQTIKNVLEFSPAVLQRFVNFMNNPDERTAVEQFGRGDKYFGCMLMMITMPGLPMIGHGQIEGFTEKYGMEYRKAYWDEQVDEDMVRRHEREIFPLMRRRHLFSGAENFALFDFETDGGWVDENVFAYVNGTGDERALIFFNNGYESTGGRVRLASAVNTGSAEEPHLHRRSLAEALGLRSGAGLWYVFRDHVDGLQYLRAVDELCEQGLHTHLNGYQSRALLGWRALQDEDGLLARLAAQLQGGGVPDLALARRRLQIETPLARVRGWMPAEVLSWLETAAPAPTEPDADAATPEDETGPTDAVGAAAASSPAEAGDPNAADEPDSLSRLPAPLAALAVRLLALPDLPQPAGLGRRSADDLRGLLAGTTGSGALQAIYLAAVLARTADRDDPVTSDLEPSDLPLVAQDMTGLLRDWCGHDYAAHRTARLAETLAAAGPHIADLAAGRTTWLPALLQQPAAAESAGVHRHGGRTWIRKEQLEALIDAVALAALDRSGTAVMAVLDARALLLDQAAAAGYDLDELTARLAGPPRS